MRRVWVAVVCSGEESGEGGEIAKDVSIDDRRKRRLIFGKKKKNVFDWLGVSNFLPNRK